MVQVALTGLTLLIVWQAATNCPAARPDGQLEVQVVDSQTGEPRPARMVLRNSRGRPVRFRQPGITQHGEQFYFDGSVVLELARGQYTFDLDAGPEYRTRSGHFEIERHADDSERIEMHRFANLAQEHWYAGDLLTLAIRPQDASTVMRASQLHVLPALALPPRRSGATQPLESIQTIPDGGRYFGLVGAAGDGAAGLNIFNLAERINLSPRTGDSPAAEGLAKTARASGGRIVVANAADAMLPVYVATGEIDAVGIITPPQLSTHPAIDYRAFDTRRDRDSRRAGQFAEQIYYNLLEAGFRIAPAAGSGVGIAENAPFGQACTWVFVEGEFTYDRWWEGLAAGRVFVTNGPLLRPLVRGQPPGYVFRINGGETLELEIGLNLATRDKVDYLEVIKNGRVEYSVPLHEWADQGGRLPTLQFDQSGWFAIRAVTADMDRYQLALSGPYYVESAGTPRISRRAAAFFLEGLTDALAEEIADDNQAALEWARERWEQRLSKANAD